METIAIRLRAEKETPGTQRYAADDPNAPVRFIYLKKVAFTGSDVPKVITVTIAAAAN